jgi:multicomponent Na+:H+ antiporter subunit G
MEKILSEIMMLIGAVFMLIASLGVVRLPDLFMRMHSNTKSATLGVFFMMLGLSIHFGTLSIFIRALSVVLFFMITAPVAAQIIARAAYFSGIPLWKGTMSDDLKGHYDLSTHVLTNPDSPRTE